MKTIFTYKAFGICFLSEFEIPELILTHEKSDVNIRLGKTPANLNKEAKRGVKFQATKNEFLLEVDQIAKYYVKDGNEIVVEPYTKPNEEVRLFLLGSAFGALFLQRGLLPIHGSAVKFGNSASIFTGLSGVGKSTIASYFAQNNFQVLADDISVLREDLKVYAGFPKMKLWKDVLKAMHIETEGLLKIRPELEKFHIPISNYFYAEPLPLNRVFILNSKNSKGFEAEELTGIRKFNAIKNHTYRFRFVQGLEQHVDHFKILNNLLPNIKVYRISRPNAPIMIKELADYLIHTFDLKNE